MPLQQTWPAELAARYRQAGYWRAETFPEFLERRVQRSPGRTAIVGGNERWTYAQLQQRANAAAAHFIQLGLVPGERVIVHLGNIPEFFQVVFGLFRAGLVPVYALPAHREAEIVHFAHKSEASAYVIGPSADRFDYRALAAKVRSKSPLLRHIIEIDTLPTAIDAAAGELPRPPSAPSDVAFLQISGGSTGLSKLIPRTHDDYIYSFRASAEICGLNQDSVYLAALPISHNFPMSSPGVFGTLYAGGTVVLSPSPDPATAFALIEREQVTITALVPPLALLWLHAAPTIDADLSSLKLLQVGGAKLTPEIARRIRPVLGCSLQQVFGMAEGLVNYTRLDDPEEIIVTTQGRPISPDDELLIVDDEGRPVPENQPGHLLTRGPYTIRAYHNEPVANRRSFTDDGFYRTGDIVKRTAEGYLVVQGRAHDHINRAGEKISAEEIEDHLLAHPDVFDAAVVSIPDEYLGERSCAFIIAKEQKPRPAQLKAWIRERGLAAYKIPDQIVLVEDFQTTAVGKISRRELRAALRNQLMQQLQNTDPGAEP